MPDLLPGIRPVDRLFGMHRRTHLQLRGISTGTELNLLGLLYWVRSSDNRLKRTLLLSNPALSQLHGTRHNFKQWAWHRPIPLHRLPSANQFSGLRLELIHIDPQLSITDAIDLSTLPRCRKLHFLRQLLLNHRN